VDTGYYIDADKMIYGPKGRTPWSVVFRQHGEVVWGRAGDTGHVLVGGAFYAPGGRMTSYYVIENGSRRAIHGPEDHLPWS
jgi:hypothetical protein